MSHPEVQIIPANAVSWDMLAHILSRGYADYPEPASVTSLQLRQMVAAWDIDLSGSAVALREGEGLVGIGLLALRGRRAWISGLAVVPEWRHRGVGRAILNRLIHEARERDAAHAILEVLIDNEPAIALYKSTGFRIRRELLTWERHPEEGPLPVPPLRAERSAVTSLVQDFDAWHPEPPRWQRELRSLRPFLKSLDGWALREGGQVAAYALTFERGDELDLVDVGIAPWTTARAVARPLLQSLQLLHMDYLLTLRYLPAGDPLSPVLAALGFHVRRRQYEMRLELAPQRAGGA